MRTAELSEVGSRLSALADLARTHADEIAIFSVANLKDATPFASDYDRQTEYFSESELEQIVGSFRANGFYCDVFVGELDFMRWAMAGGHRRFPRRRVFVYNTAQSGGGAGRKSLIPAFCALHGIETLNSNPYAVSLARHKFHVNAILRSVGVPAAEAWWYLGRGDWLGDHAPPKGKQLLSKSSYESASIGIGRNARFMMDANANAFLDQSVKELNQPVVVQEFVAGREAETPVVVDVHPLVLAPVGISIDGQTNLGDAFLHFDLVANDTYGFYDFASTEPNVAARLRDVAAAAVSALQLEGFCRVDARIDADGNPFVTDVSTTPHLTEHSSFDFRFKGLGGRDFMMAALVGLAVSQSSSLSKTGDPTTP
jgi:D-alanine-D-alanine ligase